MKKSLVLRIIARLAALWRSPYSQGQRRHWVHKSPHFVKSQPILVCTLAAFVCLVNPCPCSAAPATKATGIVIYTDAGKTGNNDAMVFEYYQLRRFDEKFEVRGKDGRLYIFTSAKVKAIVPYPDYTALAKSSPETVAAKLGETVQIYPASKRYLQPWIDSLQPSPSGPQDNKSPTEQGVTLTLKSGRAYSGCRLKSIEDGPVAVIGHSAGVARVNVDQIDEKTRKALNGTNSGWNLGPAVWGKQKANGPIQYACENGPVLINVRLSEIKDGKTAIVAHTKGMVSFDIGTLSAEDCNKLNGTNPGWNLGPAAWGKRATNGLYQYTLENGPVLIDMTLSEIKDGKTAIVTHSKGELSFDIGKLTNEDRRILNGSTKHWNLGPAAWGNRGATGVYDRYAFANGRVLSSVKIEQVTTAGFKLKHSEGEITVPIDDLLRPPATDPIHSAIREVLSQMKSHDELVQQCKQNDTAFWKAESKDFVPLRTPWVTLMVPKIFKFSTVEIDHSYQMQSIVAKYNHEKCPILGVGAPVSGEQALTITIHKDVDELLEIPFLTKEINTYARDELVTKAKRGKLRTCGGHSYYICQSTSTKPLQLYNEAPDARMWHSDVTAYPVEKGLPVIYLSLWTSSSEELAKQAPLLVKMVDSMIVEVSDSQLVLKNWKMNEAVSETWGLRRPPDVLLDLLWRQGRPPEILQLHHTRNIPVDKYSYDALKFQPVNEYDQLPWLGCHIDQVWANFDLRKTRRQGQFELFQYDISYLQFPRNGKASYVRVGMRPLPGCITGLCDRDGKAIAFEINWSCYGCVTDSDDKEKHRDMTEEDLRLLMKACIPSFAITTTELELQEAKKRPVYSAGGLTFEHKGIEVYSTKDGTVIAALDFGDEVKGGGDTSFRNMRILFLKPEAVAFFQKHGYNLEKAYEKAEKVEVRNEWKSPRGGTPGG